MSTELTSLIAYFLTVCPQFRCVNCLQIVNSLIMRCWSWSHVCLPPDYRYTKASHRSGKGVPDLPTVFLEHTLQMDPHGTWVTIVMPLKDMSFPATMHLRRFFHTQSKMVAIMLWCYNHEREMQGLLFSNTFLRQHLIIILRIIQLKKTKWNCNQATTDKSAIAIVS